MNKLILGTAQLGLDYGITNYEGKPTFQKSFELIKECLNNGVYQFDTAQAYGNAEKKLGEASIKLASFMAKTMRIITKLELPINLQKSMKHLKTNILDTVLLHNFKHLQDNNSEIWKQLQKYKTQNRIRKIGVSVYTIRELKMALQYPNMDIIQFPLNVFSLSKLNNLNNNRSNSNRFSTNNIIHLIKKFNVEIHVRSIFLQGILFLNPTDTNYQKVISRIPNGEQLAKYLNKLQQVQDELNLTRCQLLISIILSQDWISGIIMGVDNIQQLRENIKTFKLANVSKNRKQLENKLKNLLNFCKDIPDSILDPRLWK